jgi:hypothetical protein
VSRLPAEVIAGDRRGPDPRAFLEAFCWLEAQLSHGIPQPSADLEELAREAGLKHETLKRAKKALAVRSIKREKTAQEDEGWDWQLPSLALLVPPPSTCTSSTTSTTSTTRTTSPPSMESMSYVPLEPEGGEEQEVQEAQGVQVAQVTLGGVGVNGVHARPVPLDTSAPPPRRYCVHDFVQEAQGKRCRTCDVVFPEKFHP